MPTIPNLLDASTLTGAELAPIVQGGDTKKASIQLLADFVAEVVAQPAAELAAPIAAEIVAAALTTNGLLDWAYSQSFRLVSATRDSNGAITTASIIWPDGATGTFTTDTASTLFPGAIDAWHATHVVGAVTKTITQTAVTRDADGAVTAQPAITIV